MHCAKIFRSALLAALCLAVSVAAAAGEPDAMKDGIARAEAALDAGRTDEAAAIYADLVKQFPNLPALKFRLSFIHQNLAAPSVSAAGVGPASGAAVPVFAAADVAASRRDFVATLPPVRAATPLREQIAQQIVQPQKTGFQLHGRFSLGVLYDSNANSGPASDLMTLGNYPDVRIPGAQGRETAGAYFGGGLEWSYRPVCSTGWEAVGDFRWHIRGNANSDLGDMDNRSTEWFRLGAGARYADQRNLFDIRLKGELYDYQFNKNVHSFGGEATYLRAITDSFQLITRGNLDYRWHSDSNDTDGFAGSAGEYARVFLGTPLEDGRRHSLYFGARYYGGDAKNYKNQRYNAWEGLFQFSYELPHKVEVTPYISYAQEYYKGPGTVLETEKRRDKRFGAGVNVSWEFKKNWLLEAGYQYTKNRSNSNINKYDRHIVTGGVAFGF